MEFCTNCDNMYYISIDSENSNKLTYYCRYCGNTDPMTTKEGLCVLKTEIEKGEQKFNHIINPYTKLDPTLPRIKNIKCPNNACPTNEGSSSSGGGSSNNANEGSSFSGGGSSNEESLSSGGGGGGGKKETDIIYMRYDDVNMKYLYLCVDCDMVWKTDDIKN